MSTTTFIGSGPPSSSDVIVLGGGAAGLMCAAIAGARGCSVSVLERSERVGKKILISGGGRCNFTNVGAAPENYICGQSAFPRSALARYTPDDFIALVEKYDIAFHEKKLGQLFCNGSSRQIVQMLLAECSATGNVRIETGITAHRLAKEGDIFRIDCNRGERRARSVVIATGGLSYPQLGASGFAHEVALGFGLRVTELRPGLVPLTMNGESLTLCQELAGVSTPCVARSAGGPAFRESLLFTHRGLSGPAALQASSYLKSDGQLTFDLLPDCDDVDEWSRSCGDLHLVNALAHWLPARLAQAFCRPLDGSLPLKKHSPKKVGALISALRRWTVQPTGDEGYPKAEVTLGGVDVRDLDSRTMGARNVPGLYFIGEAVDVTGQLGGYNFQWAWASGFAAGEAV